MAATIPPIEYSRPATKALGRRAVAIIIDGIILTAIIGGIASAAGDLDTSGTWELHNQAPYFGIGFAYFWILETLFNATIGKAITGVRVRERDGGRAGFIRVFVRNLIRPIDSIGGYLVGWIVAMISGEDRRGRLGDLLGGTYVVRSR
jgi:uncharacterized RDD family membrane protein YckC